MKNKQIILFDGVCNLCNTSVQFVLKHEKQNSLYFSSLQSDFSQQFIKEKKLQHKYLDTILFINADGEVFMKTKAIAKIAKHLKFPFNLISILDVFPATFCKYSFDFVYDFIASNRYKMLGKKEVCYIPDKKLQDRFLD